MALIPRAFGALAIAALLTAGARGAEARLSLGVATPSPTIGRAGFACPRPGALSKSYETPNVYAAGAAQDTKDAANAAAFQADAAQFQAFMHSVNTLATLYLLGSDRAESPVQTPPGDQRVAACLIKTLAAAARAGSLTGDLSPQAFGLRLFITPALAFDFAAVGGAGSGPGGDPTGDRAAIAAWLKLIADKSMTQQQALAAKGNTPGAPHRVNNIYYWTGYGALTVAVATGDKDRFEWGRKAILTGLNAIDANGFMPPEVARDAEALQYHAFALQPLSMGSYILSANGEAPSHAQLAALQRAAERTAQGLMDPAGFARDMAALAGGKDTPQRDVPRAPPFVPIVIKLLGPSPQVAKLRARVLRTGPGYLGPSADDLFR